MSPSSAVSAAALFASFSVLTLPSFGVDWPTGTTKSSDVVLGSDSALLPTGVVTLPDGGAEAGTLTVKQVPGATQTVTGVSLAFGPNAVVDPGDGGIVFDTSVTGDGGLTAGRPDKSNDCAYNKSLPTPQSGNPPVEVLTGTSLALLLPRTATGEGSNLAGSTFGAYCVKSGEGWMEVQYQNRAEGSKYLKSLKVRYEQTTPTAPVTAIIVYGKYIHVDQCPVPTPLGTDTDDPAFDEGQPGVNFYKTGYGICAATFLLKRQTVAFRGVPRIAGAFTNSPSVASDVLFREDDPDTFTTPLSLKGSALFQTALTNLTFRPGSVVCAGQNVTDVTLGFAAAEGASAAELERTYGFSGKENFYPTSWTLVFPHQTLANLTNVTAARMGGHSAAGDSDSVAAVVRFFRNDGVKASFQICLDTQVNALTNLYKNVLVELRQGMNGVEVRSPTAGYIRGAKSDYPDGYDALVHGWVAGQNFVPSSGNYDAKTATYLFGRAPRVLVPDFSLANNNQTGFYGTSVSLASSADTMLWCETVESGRCFARSNRSGCTLDLLEGGVLTTPKEKTLDLYSTCFYLHPGSLFMPSQQALAHNNRHVVDHAILLLGADIAGADRYAPGRDSQTYVGLITLNGGRIAGAAARFGVGGTQAAVVTVLGDDPSRFDNGIMVYSERDKATTVTFDVANVTADAAADLVVGGGLMPCMSAHRANYDFSTVRKTGDGMMRIDGVNTYAHAIDVQAGTIAYTANGGLGTEGVYTLSGGGLAFAADTTNTVKTLTVAAAGGSIVLGEDASFTVPSATVLTLNGCLDVTQPEGAVFRVGSAVSAAQLRRIRVNGCHVVQRTDGSFDPVGFMLLVK